MQPAHCGHQLWLLVLFCGCFLHGARGMVTQIAEQRIPRTTSAWHHYVDHFRFEAGDTLHYSMEVSPVVPNATYASFFVAGCTEEGVKQLSLSDFARACHDFLPVQLPQCPLVFINSANYDSHLPAGGYLFYMVKCPGPPLTINGDLVMRSAGGDYLSSEQRHYPLLYEVDVMAWFPVVAAACAIYWLNSRHGISLQRLMLFVPVAKFVCTVLTWMYFGQSAATGHFPAAIPYIFSLVYLTYNITLYGIMMLIASGLHISRHHLPWTEVKSIFIIVLWYSITVFIYSNSNLYIWLFWAGVYCAMMFKIINLASSTMHRLKNQHGAYSQAQDAEGTDRVVQKIRLFNRIMLAFLGFLLLDLVLHVITFSSTRTAPWKMTIVEEILELIFVVFVGFYLRPMRDGNPLFGQLGVLEQNASDEEQQIPPLHIHSVHSVLHDHPSSPSNDIEMGITQDESPPVPGSVVLVKNPGGKTEQLAMGLQIELAPESRAQPEASGKDPAHRGSGMLGFMGRFNPRADRVRLDQQASEVDGLQETPETQAEATVTGDQRTVANDVGSAGDAHSVAATSLQAGLVPGLIPSNVAAQQSNQTTVVADNEAEETVLIRRA